jgi:hypothetical protein
MTQFYLSIRQLSCAFTLTVMSAYLVCDPPHAPDHTLQGFFLTSPDNCTKMLQKGGVHSRVALSPIPLSR